MYTLPKLNYGFDNLEPYIDSKTMEIHYTKHHQSYIDKLNSALEKYPDLQKLSVEELIRNLDKVPEEIRTAVKNNGGGHLNHSFFWPLLKKDVPIDNEISNKINESFKSFDNFKKQFIDSATKLFGSGWTWLIVKDDNSLEIMNTSNQDSPISQNKSPILTVDVWEHAYYLKYQNKRQEYLDAFFNIINWDEVNKNYIKIIKLKGGDKK